MPQETTRDRTAADIVGDSALTIEERKVRKANEFADSDVGQALFYGTAMARGAQMGGQVQKSWGDIKDGVGELTQFFKDRKGERAKWNAMSDEEQGSFANFRDFFRQKTRNVDISMNKFQAGEDMEFHTKDGTVNLGPRSLKPLEDRNKLRAFFLNSTEDWKFDPSTESAVQVNQGTNILKIQPMPARPSGSFLHSPTGANPQPSMDTNIGVQTGDTFNPSGVSANPSDVSPNQPEPIGQASDGTLFYTQEEMEAYRQSKDPNGWYAGSAFSGAPLIGGGTYQGSDFMGTKGSQDDIIKGAGGYLNLMGNAVGYGWQNATSAYQAYMQNPEMYNKGAKQGILNSFRMRGMYSPGTSF